MARCFGMKLKTIIAALFALVCVTVPALAQIEAGQSVVIKIMGVPAEEKAKINDTYPVSKKGLLNMPFIGEIRAAGLESDDLAKAIQNAYRDGGIYDNATIQVMADFVVVPPIQQQVHLAGHVRAPGPKAFAKGLTVFQAVNAAGGATEFGAMNRVILWREGKQQKINLETAEGKGVVTVPDDTIEVPEKNIIGK